MRATPHPCVHATLLRRYCEFLTPPLWDSSSAEWHDATVMRTAYMPREASPVPVPHNPFRHNRSAADLVLASSKARWPKDAASRDSAGRPRAPLTESKAETAARTPLSPSEYTGARA